MNKTRDRLAEEHASEGMLYQDPRKDDLTQMIRLAFKAGWDAHEERAKVLEICLETIITEYNKPPYCEFDWIAWKQRSEKALAEWKRLQE